MGIVCIAGFGINYPHIADLQIADSFQAKAGSLPVNISFTQSFIATKIPVIILN